MKNSLNDLSYEELVAKKEELSKRLRDLRFAQVLGQIENKLEIRTVRHSIGRVNTILHEYSLGIRNREA